MHINTRRTLMGFLIMRTEAHRQWKRYCYLHGTGGKLKKRCYRGSSVIGLFTTFVQTIKHLCAKSALDLVHALLGVSHSWWALEIASFLSRWHWAGPSWLTSHSGVSRLWGAYARSSKHTVEGPASFIVSSWCPFCVPVQPAIDPKGKKGNVASLKTNSALKIDFFFFWC